MSGVEIQQGHQDDEKTKDSSIRLLHSSLHTIPQQMRFGAVGVISNILFLTGYSFSLDTFEPMGFPPSSIYSIYYMMYIPMGHMLTCLFVFGWPTHYLSSLMSNVPIGITSMMLGATTTGWLDKIDFDASVFEFLQMHAQGLVGKQELVKEDIQGTYSSIVVMVLTGLWTFILTSMVMAPPKKKDDLKKE